MARSRTVETLRLKKAEIEWAVEAYGKKYRKAQADLAHLTAAISIFDATGDRKTAAAYANFHSLWKPGQLLGLCRSFLEEEGPLSTRELAARAIKASDMDPLDQVLATIVANKIVYIMRAQEKRRVVIRPGVREGAALWELSKPHDAANSLFTSGRYPSRLSFQF